MVAAVGNPGRGEGLAELGAREIVSGPAELEGLVHLDRALDTVGGPMLARAFAALAAGGRLWSVGQASGQPTTFGPDLTELLDLIAHGALTPVIGWRGPWTAVAQASDELRGRRLSGKAVLDVLPEPGPER